MIGEIFKSNGFGYYEVISYKNAHNITVRFLETGYEKTTNKSNIIRGAVKDKFAPSCYGVGMDKLPRIPSFQGFRHVDDIS